MRSLSWALLVYRLLVEEVDYCAKSEGNDEHDMPNAKILLVIVVFVPLEDIQVGGDGHEQKDDFRNHNVLLFVFYLCRDSIKFICHLF